MQFKRGRVKQEGSASGPELAWVPATGLENERAQFSGVMRTELAKVWRLDAGFSNGDRCPRDRRSSTRCFVSGASAMASVDEPDMEGMDLLV